MVSARWCVQALSPWRAVRGPQRAPGATAETEAMGGDLHEIVDAGQVGRLFAILALLLPAAGLLCGWWYGVRRGTVRHGVAYGLLIGLLGPLNWALWLLYNR